MTVPTCAVLRCDHQGTVPVDLNRATEPLLETLVCSEHAEAMERGEHWAWSEQAGAVVMGADLDDATA